MITVTDINNAYTRLAQAAQDNYKATELEIESGVELERELLAAINDGRIDGKNEQQRQAKARELFAELHQAHEQNGRNARCYKFQLDMARLEVERIKMLFRALERLPYSGVVVPFDNEE